jgi:hypothetical protein
MTRRRRSLTMSVAAAGLALLAAIGGGAAPPDLDPALPGMVSEQIIADLARSDLDAFAVTAAKYIAPDATERLKNNFAAIKDLGRSQYSEMIYSRDYGKTQKDIIYKINFQKAFAFVRFLWHVDSGNWQLVHLGYKTEGSLPFPRDWEHIYPR